MFCVAAGDDKRWRIWFIFEASCFLKLLCCSDGDSRHLSEAGCHKIEKTALSHFSFLTHDMILEVHGEWLTFKCPNNMFTCQLHSLTSQLFQIGISWVQQKPKHFQVLFGEELLKLLGLHIDNYKQLFFCKAAEALVLKVPVTDRETKQLYHSQHEGIVLYLKFILLSPNTRINN